MRHRRDPALVNHQGVVLAFTAPAGYHDLRIFYQVLDPAVETGAEPGVWCGERELTFPDQLRPAGFDLVTVDLGVGGPSGFAPGPFQVFSDQTYVYVVRLSTDATLWLTRFVLVDTSAAGQFRYTLEQAWETRFRESGKKDVPADGKDTLSGRSPVGEPFREPIVELPMARDVAPGQFAVFLVPSVDTADASNPGRWQVLSVNQASGRVEAFSMPRSGSGLFDLADAAEDPQNARIAPDAAFRVALAGPGGQLSPLEVASGLTTTVYFKQEPATGPDGSPVQVKRNARVMVCFVAEAAQGHRHTVALDLGVASDGSLAVLPDVVPLSPIDAADQVLSLQGSGRVALTNVGGSLGLHGSYTIEAWVNPSALPAEGEASVVCGANQPDVGEAPYLRIGPDGSVIAGFGDGSRTCSVRTAAGVVTPGTWQQLAVVFDAPSGSLRVYRNAQPLPGGDGDFPGSIATGRPVAELGSHGFTGAIDEVRVWALARSAADLRRDLYRELADPAEISGLRGYWPLDRVDVHDSADGLVLTTPDLSAYGNTATLHDAVQVPSTSPVATVSSGQLLLDGRGLTSVVGVLDERIAPASTPALTVGVDGSLHLYFEDSAGEFSYATCSTTATRAVYAVPWSTLAGEVGELWLVSRRVGPQQNDFDVAVTPAPEPAHCDLALTHGGAEAESWHLLPRSASAAAEVLNGLAVDTPDDARLALGEARFFDYAGIYPASRLGCTGGGSVAVVSRRPGSLPLQGVDVAEAGATGTVTLRFEPAGGQAGRAVQRTWPNVPMEPSALCDTLNGRNPHYDYHHRDPVEPPGYALPTATSSTVLVLAVAERVVGLACAVTPGPLASRVDRCAVSIVVSHTDPDDGEVIQTELHWPDVPRQQSSFAAAVGSTPDATGRLLADFAAVCVDGLPADVLDATVDAPAGLWATIPLVTAISEDASGPVATQQVTATTAQRATSTDPTAHLQRGSALFAAVRVGDNLTGPDLLRDGAVISPTLSGTAGGWQVEPARYGLAVDGNGALVDVTRPGAEALRLTRDLTVEAWVEVAAEAKPDRDLPPPETVVYAHLPGAGGLPTATYRLGVESLPALRLMQGMTPNPTGTTVDAYDETGTLVGESAWTVALWLRPNLSNMPADYQDVWALTHGPRARTLLRLRADGTMQAELFHPAHAGEVMRVEFNARLTNRTWVHVAVVRDGYLLRLYLDGKLDRELDVPPNFPTYADAFTLGGNTGTLVLDTLCNDVRVYSRDLTAPEVATLPQRVQANYPGLTLFWPLTEPGGEVAHNLAPTGPRLDGAISDAGFRNTPGVYSGVFAGAGERLDAGHSRALGHTGWHHVAAAYRGGGAVEFDGAGHADCGTDSALTFGEAMSVDLWVMPAADRAPADEVLAAHGSLADGDCSWMLALNRTGVPAFTVCLRDGDDTVVLSTTATAAIPAARASHLAGTVEIHQRSDDGPARVVMSLYVDGTLAAVLQQAAVAPRIAASTAPVTLGALAPGSDAGGARFGLRGLLSDVRLWSLALPASAVQAITGTARPANTDGLMAWWRLAETSGVVAADSVGDNAARLTSEDRWRPFPATSVCRLYLDGQLLDARDPFTTERLAGYTGPPQFTIGGIRGADSAMSASLSGQVDEVRVWSAMRTAQQIRATRDTPLDGTEAGLAGYWRFDAGSGVTVVDSTSHGNAARLVPDAAGRLPAWVVSTAPVSTQAPQLRNALGGLDTPQVVRISGTPAVVDYGDVERDAYADMQAVMKRCYLVIAKGGEPQSYLGFKVGDLTVVHLGQLQTRPTLVGYIEGAPPVPSENLTQPLYTSPGSPVYRIYNASSTLTLTQADQTTYTISAEVDRGEDTATNAKAGWAFKGELFTGMGIMTKVADVEVGLGLHTKLDASSGDDQAREATATVGRTISESVDLRGDWEEGAGGHYLNDEVGRRFQPHSLGYAQVKSLTADLYGARLRGTGALVSTSVVPNPAIPEEVNLVAFPLDPRYVRQGTLDGRVGLVADPETSVSYFRPADAYALKRRIEAAAARLETYWSQCDAGERAGALGVPLRADPAEVGSALESAVEGGDASSALARRGLRASLANTYVWTADGGLYKEEQQATSHRTDSYGGSYNLSALAGPYGSVSITALSGAGFVGEFDLLIGHHVRTKVSRSRESSESFGLTVGVTGERYLKGAILDADAVVTGYTPGPVPGKVNAYRFTTFYLAPDAANREAFENQVVDQAWLAASPSAAAALLRGTQAATNEVWRVLHRVTYVERIPPAYQPIPEQSEPPGMPPTANLSANSTLVQLAVALLKPAAQPSPAEIGAAVGTLLDTPAGPSGQCLADALPWWEAFRKLAAESPPAARTLAALRRDLVSYLLAGYATGELR